MSRMIGEVQWHCLRALSQHGQFPGGWVWDYYSRTVKVLESLTRRGLAVEGIWPAKPGDREPRRFWRISDAGKAELDKSRTWEGYQAKTRVNLRRKVTA